MTDMKSESVFKKERPMFHLGPVYFSFSPLPFVVIGWFLTSFLLLMINRTSALFKMEGVELGMWDDEAKLLYFAILAGTLFILRIRVHGKLGFFLSTALYMALPCASYQLIELVNGVDGLSREPQLIFMNVVFIAVVYLLFLAIFGSYRWSGIVASTLFYCFALACYFVMLFRGTPFVPLDIFAASTGLNVASNYTFELTEALTVATVWLGLMLGVSYQLGHANLVRARWKVSVRALALMAVLGIGTAFYSQSYLDENRYVISYWDQAASYEKYGNWMAFCLNLKNVFPEKPDGYSAGAVKEMSDCFLRENGIDPKSEKAYNMVSGKNDYKPTDKKPNIIMIMNESFADLEGMGELHTNAPVMPFFNSLEENTIRGELQTSTHGGGTACTEFEALTGNSQHFLAPGTVAYSASMRDSTPSMVWNLRAQGYQAEAFHPYYASGWSREKAYAYMGFERFVALEDLVPRDIIEMTASERMAAIEQELDPQDGDVYNRDYMSDHYDFKLVQKMYEERDKSKPYFMFNVTVQNHGGYLDKSANFAEEIAITNMEGYYPQANRFLSLMNASDRAFGELITYFENVEEPTIVVMFGDHLPTLEQEFYTELFGEHPNAFNIKQVQNYYQTPFVIWANYDIPERDMGVISTNYLSPLIMETAGLKLTDYERYLALLSKSLPVISSVGYQTHDGKQFYNIEEGKREYEKLEENYSRLAYNNLIDKNHRNWKLFTHDGKALPKVEPLTHSDSEA